MLVCLVFLTNSEFFQGLKLGYVGLLLAFIIMLLAFPTLMIIVGIHNLDRCPAQKILPIWLITISGVILANGIFNFVFLSFLTGASANSSTFSSNNQPPPRNRLIDLQRFLHLVVLVFHIIWFFLGRRTSQTSSSSSST